MCPGLCYSAIMSRDDKPVIEPVRKRRLLALLKTMKPIDETFPDIQDAPVEPERVFGNAHPHTYPGGGL